MAGKKPEKNLNQKLTDFFSLLKTMETELEKNQEEGESTKA